MGTRSGDLDPAIIEFIAGKENMTAAEVVSVLNKKSGVLALSNGASSDFRDLEAGYKSATSTARLQSMHSAIVSRSMSASMRQT